MLLPKSNFSSFVISLVGSVIVACTIGEVQPYDFFSKAFYSILWITCILLMQFAIYTVLQALDQKPQKVAVSTAFLAGTSFILIMLYYLFASTSIISWALMPPAFISWSIYAGIMILPKKRN